MLHESSGQKLAMQRVQLGLLANLGSQRELMQAGLNLVWCDKTGTR